MLDENEINIYNDGDKKNKAENMMMIMMMMKKMVKASHLKFVQKESKDLMTYSSTTSVLP